MSVRVLVLGGGPDAEREVSLQGQRCVAQALHEAGFEAREQVLSGEERTTDLARLADGAVVFPVLHGAWGEGGTLQEMLDEAGLAYVGSRAPAARLCMDKLATKLLAARLGIDTPPACVLDTRSDCAAIDTPCVIKPVHDGSSVGLHVCRDRGHLVRAIEAVRQDQRERPWRAYMVERVIDGREITVSAICDEDASGVRPLQHLLIEPAHGTYDYHAKYDANDTRYVPGAPLGGELDEIVRGAAGRLCDAIGVRHLARVDFMIDRDGRPWLLEVNTLPGFTTHSLLPMACAHAGMPLPALCERLVRAAERDGVKAEPRVRVTTG